MKFRVLLFASFLLMFFAANAQHQEIKEKPSIWKGKYKEATDTTSILHAFKNGQVHGHFRYYFMFTDNEFKLSNYYANAAGGGLRYETARFYGFQFGISGFYIFNIGSSDLSARDSITNQLSRYEIGLFDIEDPHNKRDMDRLEELYLKYNFRKSNITLGKQLINTPFINLQDGRMRPTGVGGLWFHMNEIKNTEFEGGYLYAISPRSTVRWYNVGESIGLYPVGVDLNGNRSDYLHNTFSKAVAMLGITHRTAPWLRLQLWNMYIHNISHTALAQADATIKINEGASSVIGGIQFYMQHASGNGGNPNPELTYMDPDNKSLIVSTRAGWKNKKWETTLNYTRISNHGRYLMPREWGRDAFYTFLPRERNEGYGDVHAIMAKVQYRIPQSGFKSYFGAGYYDMPDVKNFRLNKYGVPSYVQLNLDLSYDFKGFLKGLDAHLLVVGKIRTGEFYGDYRYVINRNNMVLYNFMLNYHF
jgi:hypothetical protein